MYKPMLANPLEIGRDKDTKKWLRVVTEDYVMEPKLDGMRLILEFDTVGKLIHAWTRSGRDVLPQVPNDWRIMMPMLPNTVLDCEFGYAELICPIIDFNMTMRVMGSGPEEAQRKANDLSSTCGKIPTAYAFDVLKLPGYGETDDLTWINRRELMLQYLHEGYQKSGGLGIATTPLWGHWDQPTYEDYVNKGGEGVMLKHPKGQYFPAKRPAAVWFKVKKFTTADVMIVGWDPGQGKYTNQVGALVFSDANNKIGRCSGMTDTERAVMSADPDKLYGKMIEIRYFGLTAGTPRHPQFVRMRDDL